MSFRKLPEWMLDLPEFPDIFHDAHKSFGGVASDATARIARILDNNRAIIFSVDEIGNWYLHDCEKVSLVKSVMEVAQSGAIPVYAGDKVEQYLILVEISIKSPGIDTTEILDMRP